MNEYININTLFYAVIVLAVLILIMIITFFASVKPNLQRASAPAANYHSAVDNALAQIVRGEEEELVSDGELVAVITAAIYASMGDAVPSDGLVVRSIRRANTTRWKSA